jgi:hypothetical protein
MTTTLSIGYTRTFENNVRLAAQQMSSKVRDWVQVVHSASESHLWPKIAVEEMGAKSATNAVAATPVADHVWTRRRSVDSVYAIGELVQTNDIAQMIVDPKSAYVTSFGGAIARQWDNIILDAATADAITDHATTHVHFDDNAGQIVGDFDTEISFDTVAATLEVFNTNNVPMDEPKLFVIGPKQLRKLQGLVEYSSADYVSLKALSENGFVERWFGFTWVVSNLLNVEDADAEHLDCLAFTRKAIGLHISEEPTIQIAKDPAYSFDWRIYAQLTAGAVRVQDDHIVKVKVKNTVT